MSLYRRGKTWWYEFRFGGRRFIASAQTSNKIAAQQIEAAHRVRLAKGEAGLVEKKLAPTLKEFAPRFTAEIETRCADRPGTINFYAQKLRRLLEDKKLCDMRLDQIDESVIAQYTQRRTRAASNRGRPLAVASVNRELAVLRRLLRLALAWREIDRVPVIKLLRGEVHREFVLTREFEPTYLAACPQPLHDFAVIALDQGVRVSEAVGLRWSDVSFVAGVHAKLGFIVIRKGKSKSAARTLPLTERVREMLQQRKKTSKSQWVFPSPASAAVPCRGSHLDHLHAAVRDELDLGAAFVLHSLRHTFLTRLGESGCDVFSLMRIAGHASIQVSTRYVHPSTEAVGNAFEHLESVRQSHKAEAAGQGLRGTCKSADSKTRQVAKIRVSV